MNDTTNNNQEFHPGMCPDDLPQYLTVAEVASFFRISSKTVYEMVRKGQLKGRFMGRVIRVHKNQIIQSL